MGRPGGSGDAKIYFDCTEGGLNNLGQIWEYDPGRETITLLYQSTDPARLENPDNITIVPQTGDVLLCEDSPGEQFARSVTIDGEIYDFAKSQTNNTEFCGACFDPDGNTLYVNQQGDRLGPDAIRFRVLPAKEASPARSTARLVTPRIMSKATLGLDDGGSRECREDLEDEDRRS